MVNDRRSRLDLDENPKTIVCWQLDDILCVSLKLALELWEALPQISS